MKWNKELTDKAIELKNRGYTSPQISRALGGVFSDSSVRHKLAYIGESITTEAETNLKTFNDDGVQDSTAILTLMKGDKITEDKLLEAHGFDTDHWTVASANSNFWKSSGKTTSYQTKITVKPKTELAPEDIADTLNHSIQPIHVKRVKTGSRNLIIPIFDLHMGIETFDHIAPYLEQIETIIKRGYKNIDIIIGGDYFHSNFMDKTMTVSGTQLDHVDNMQALEDGTDFFSSLLETALAYSKKVSVHAIPGNHDSDKQFLWMYAMSCKYPDVAIHNSLNKRDEFMTDNIAVMIAHGNLALKHLPMLFATEYPDDWAKAKYRLIFSGHFHQQKLNDDDGVVLHQCGTAKPADNYEDSNGFTMSRRHMQVLEFDSDRLRATYEIEV